MHGKNYRNLWIVLLTSTVLFACGDCKQTRQEQILIKEQIGRLYNGMADVSTPVVLDTVGILSKKDIVYTESVYMYPEDVKGVIKKTGFINNKYTAARIAEDIWYASCGAEIYRCRPYLVSLTKGRVWVVQTAFAHPEFGSAYIEIECSGKIRRLVWGK